MTTTVDEYFLIEPDWDAPVYFYKRWLTSFQLSINNTPKRSALYTWPRRRLKYQAIANSYAEASYIKRVIFKNLNNVWGVPYWMDAAYISSQAASGQAIINVTSTQYRNFEVGAEVILFNSLSDYEVGTIASFDSTSITLNSNLLNTWEVNEKIYPILKGRIKKTKTIAYLTDQKSRIEIEVDEEYDEITRYTPEISSFPTYGSYPVFNTAPDWTEPIETTVNHEYRVLKWYGKSQDWSQWTESELRHKSLYYGESKQAISEIINFFDYHKGRWGAFWRPSWVSDVKLATTLTGAETNIEIESIAYSDWIGTAPGTYLMFLWPDGSYEIREVTSSPDNTHIVIASSLGTAVTSAQLSKMLVSFISLSIFNQDEIEIKYTTDSKADIQLNFRDSQGDS